MVASLTNAGRLARMNSLTTYWLCRAPGSATEGPFTLGQLKSMYATGAIHAQALICEHGGEEWSEARWMLEAEEKPIQNSVPRVIYVKEKKDKKGSCGCLAALACVIVFAVALNYFGDGVVTEQSAASKAIDLQFDVKRWVRTELADKDAELMGMSEPVLVKGQYYRAVRLRGKNAFGGPVVNDFISSSSTAERITWMESLKKFKETAKYDEDLGEDGAKSVAAALGFSLE